MAYISYSGYSLLRDCPFSYYKRYIVKERVLQDKRPAFEGISMQKLFEEFYIAKKHLVEEDDALVWLNEKIIGVFETVQKEEGIVLNLNETSEEVANISRKFIEVFWKLLDHVGLLKASVKCEYAFKFAYPEGLIGGRLDFYDPTLPIVIDAKGIQKRNIRYLDADQLRFYALNTWKETGFIPKTAFLLYCVGDIRWLQLKEENLVAFESRVRATLSSLRKKDVMHYLPKKGKACRFCPYDCPIGGNLKWVKV